ncbi:MAG: hypothetical protein ACLQLG_06420 [Thermoguttaceae bacterium]
MKSRISWCALVLAVAGFCPPAAAQDNCLRSFFTGVAKDTARRNCWPTPFIYPARQAAREPFANMVANGWEVQNMLTDGHFDVETGSLTPAGQAMVLRILNDTPQQHRGIFVHRARTPEETATHIHAVEQFVEQSVPPSEYPTVLESRRSADGYPAESYDVVRQKFLKALPDPKLAPADSSSTSASSTPH